MSCTTVRATTSSARRRRWYSAAEIAAALGLPAPTAEQTRVIEHPLTSMLVVAGAGSGKTETMASRVVWLVANGLVAPQDVLGLTFTRRAAGELAERIGRRLRRLREAGLWAPRAGGGPEAARVLGGAAIGEPDVGEADPAARAEPGVEPRDEPGDESTVEPTVSTYHAYAGRLVREFGLRLGIEPDARILSEAAAWQLAHEVVTRYEGPMEGLELAGSTVTAAVVGLSGELAEHLRAPREVRDLLRAVRERLDSLPRGQTQARNRMSKECTELREHTVRQELLVPILEAYARAKAERDCLDFADQMALAARLAETFPAVATAQRARHRVVLLDEFQDTSEAQMRLLRALFIDPAGGQRVPVTAVGDPHQSIYGWRGASAATLARFPARFAAAGEEVATLALSTSWRNGARILEVANATARPLRERSSVRVERLTPAPGAEPGRVRAARFATDRDEAHAVAETIAQAWWQGPARRVRSGTTAAVLCRRRAQFPAIVDALRAQGLPVEVVGLGGLLSTPEIGDLVALLTVVDDPARGDQLMRLLTGPATRLGPADIDALGAWSRLLHRRFVGGNAASPAPEALPGLGRADDPSTEALSEPGPADGVSGLPRAVAVESHERASLVEALTQLPPPGWRGPEGQSISPTGRARLEALARVVDDVRLLADHALPDLVDAAVRTLGLDVEVLASADVPPGDAGAHLDAFVEAAAGYAAGADRPDLGGFLAWLDAARAEERGLDTPAAHASQDAVQVLTVHAAKGLEWDLVAVPGLVEGAFPSHRAGVSTFRGGRWQTGAVRDRGWLSGIAGLPFELRGDADGLARLPWRRCADLAELEAALGRFVDDGGHDVVAEERRLGYVAFTRARHELLLTCAVWTDAKTPRVTSRLLTEILDRPGLLVVGPWEPMPDPTDGLLVHPLGELDTTALWPAPPDPRGAARVRAAADVVRAELARGHDDPGNRDGLAEEADDLDGLEGLAGLDADLEALLAEHAERQRPRREEVSLPGHLSTSAVVQLAHDPQAYLLRLRRPMPAPVAPEARRGTLFHAWLEKHFGRAALVDLDELPGRADPLASDEVDLDRLIAHFLRSPWASRSPLDIEMAVETVVAGMPIRGRIDAVFRRAGGGFVLVDWKTGRRPEPETLRWRAMQLALYRLAFCRLRGLREADVDAAFYFISSGQTVYPELPSESQLLAHLARLVRPLGDAAGGPPGRGTADFSGGRADR